MPALTASGSVSLTVTDARYATKGPQLVNVKDAPYSAAGDGVTDDRAAILAAISAVAAGGTVLFPPGSYLVDAPLAITKACTLQGPATILKGAVTTVAGNFITANVGGVTFGNLTMTDPNSKVTGTFFSSGAAISDIYFDHCTVNAPASVAVRLARVTKGGMVQSFITACRVGIQIENDADQITCTDVTITNWTDRGVYVLGTTNTPSNITLERVRVRGFVVNGGGTARYAIMATKGAAPNPIQTIAILDCEVEGPNYSWTDPTNPGTADQIALFNSVDFRVVGCASRLGGDMGITIDGSCSRGVVSDNISIGNDSAGVAVWTGAKSVAVTGNTLMNNGQNRHGDRATYTRAGVRASGAIGLVVAGNVLGDDQGTKTQKYGVSMTACTNVSLGPDTDTGNALATYYKDGVANVNIVKATTAAF